MICLRGPFARFVLRPLLDVHREYLVEELDEDEQELEESPHLVLEALHRVVRFKVGEPNDKSLNIRSVRAEKGGGAGVLTYAACGKQDFGVDVRRRPPVLLRDPLKDFVLL